MGLAYSLASTFIAGSIPGGGIHVVPDSPGWLIANGRSEEAKAILTKYHAEGTENDPMVELEYYEMKQIIKSDLLANETTWRAM